MFFNRTPHRRLITYFLFKAASPEAAFAELQQNELGYLFKSVSDVEPVMEAMRASMPEALREWHQYASFSKPLPPDDAEASRWCDVVGILKFYEQLMNRSIVPRDEEFHNAWRLFGMKTFRRMAEGMCLSEVQPSEICQKLKTVGAPLTIGAMDIFFDHFFVTRDFSEDQLAAWVDGIGEYARSTGSPSYTRDWDSKWHALNHKLDIIGVMSRLGALMFIERHEMTTDVRHRMYANFARFDSDMAMGRLSREEYLRRQASSARMESLGNTIMNIIKTEQICKFVKTDERRPTSLALLGSGDLLTREVLLARGALVKPKAGPGDGFGAGGSDDPDRKH